MSDAPVAAAVPHNSSPSPWGPFLERPSPGPARTSSELGRAPFEDLRALGARLSPEAALAFAWHVAAALGELHERGLAHGKLDPGHVGVNADGRLAIYPYQGMEIVPDPDPSAGAQARDCWQLGPCVEALGLTRLQDPSVLLLLSGLRRARGRLRLQPGRAARQAITAILARYPEAERALVEALGPQWQIGPRPLAWFPQDAWERRWTPMTASYAPMRGVAPARPITAPRPVPALTEAPEPPPWPMPPVPSSSMPPVPSSSMPPVAPLPVAPLSAVPLPVAPLLVAPPPAAVAPPILATPPPATPSIGLRVQTLKARMPAPTDPIAAHTASLREVVRSATHPDVEQLDGLTELEPAEAPLGLADPELEILPAAELKLQFHPEDAPSPDPALDDEPEPVGDEALDEEHGSTDEDSVSELVDYAPGQGPIDDETPEPVDDEPTLDEVIEPARIDLNAPAPPEPDADEVPDADTDEGPDATPEPAPDLPLEPVEVPVEVPEEEPEPAEPEPAEPEPAEPPPAALQALVPSKDLYIENEEIPALSPLATEAADADEEDIEDLDTSDSDDSPRVTHLRAPPAPAPVEPPEATLLNAPRDAEEPRWGEARGVGQRGSRDAELGMGKWTEPARPPSELARDLPLEAPRPLQLEADDEAPARWPWAAGAAVVLAILGYLVL